MDRREFVRRSALTGAFALTGWQHRPDTLLAPPGAQRAVPVAASELDEITIARLQEGMASGTYTARSIAELYLARIEDVDRRGPGVNSVIELNPDALAIADTMDRERRDGRVRGPLHGIPVLIKDNIDSADSMKTSAGSLALADVVATQDAFIVRRLRDAGAVLLGKTNLSEWANFRSTHSVSGWSARGGQTRNPYALDRNPCGSSSGTGAAIASNLAAVGVGTETDGSILCPASACGLVGIKPSIGLVSRSGIVPIAHSQDTAGPMARTVTDAAILLGALAGTDPSDSSTAAARGRGRADYREFLRPDGLRAARIGVARDFFGFNDKVDRAMEDAIAAMKSAGAVVIDPVRFPTKGKFDDAEFEVLLYEFKADLNSYLARSRSRFRTLAALIEFNRENREREMPFFGQEIFEMAEKKGPLTSAAYRTALAKCRRQSRSDGIDAALQTHRLDAFVAPTGGPAWVIDPLNGDHYTGGSSTPAAVAGYASITVPAGSIHGMPVGISFIGGAFSESTLLRLAFGFERAFPVRQAPKFLPTADLRT